MDPNTSTNDCDIYLKLWAGVLHNLPRVLQVDICPPQIRLKRTTDLTTNPAQPQNVWTTARGA